MSDNQATTRSRMSGGRIAVLGVAATALALLNMSTDSEAQSSPVLVLEYIFLAVGLLAFFGGIIIMMTPTQPR